MENTKKEEKTNFLNLQEAFNVFDKDNDGSITIKELRTAMRSLGYNPSAEELQDLIREYDKDDSGTIELNEFMKLMTNKIKEQEEVNQLIEMFEVFDRNGDGLLSKDEIKNLFDSINEEISDEILEEFIKEADLDNDGKINFQEFVNLLTMK
jgi:Ca2+-binding EF-hand superfamily protein